MSRTALLLAVLTSAAAAAGCGSGQAQPPAGPLPPLSAKAPPPAAAPSYAGPMTAPVPPRP